MTHIHFLHGFLGLPIDWSPLLLHLKSTLDQEPQYHLHNIWKESRDLPNANLRDYALHFSQKIPPSGNILVGYSMGGRLAMHFPTWEQRKLKGIVLISAHPGMENSDEKALRAQHDGAWAQRFQKDDWAQLVSDWNDQPIFAHDRVRPPRKESDFCRASLSRALTQWSLAEQDDMVARLKEFQCPIYYFHGQKDEKFSSVAQRLRAELPKARIHMVMGAGHSPHFSHPLDIAKAIKPLINPPGTALV